MEMLGTLEGLQRAAAFRVMCNKLKLTAVAPAIIGFFLTMIGLIATTVGTGDDKVGAPKVGLPLVALGVVFLAVAVWTAVAAKPHSLIVNGILLTGVGVGLIGLFVWGAPTRTGKDRPRVVLTLGLVTGYWGLATLARYKKVKATLANLDPMSVSRVDEFLTGLKEANIADNPEYIQFQVGGNSWKGRFFSDAVLLLCGNLRPINIAADLRFLPKADFNLERLYPQGSGATPGKKIKLTISVGPGHRERGTMGEHCLQRYESWKSG